MNKIDSETIILIPTYNEKNNLAELTRRIRAEVAADILFIDDRSPDGTGKLAEALAGRDSGIHVLHRPKKTGIGDAYKDGFRWALKRPYQYFLMMDADLSHDPQTLPLFLENIRECDAVFASRYRDGVSVRDWSAARLCFSRFSNAFIRRALDLRRVTDCTTAFKCFRRGALETIGVENLKGKKNAFLIHLTYETVRRGLRIREIPSVFFGRKKGKSKSGLSIVTESIGVIFLLFLQRLCENKESASFK